MEQITFLFILQFKARAILRALSIADLFGKRGFAPGCPVQIGHMFVLGGEPKAVEHPQKIFDLVLSWV